MFAFNCPAAAATVANGDFANGLTSWQSSGSTNGDAGIGVVTDHDVAVSRLFQSVAVTSGNFTLQFDFRNALSDVEPDNALPDGFFATIYFTDNSQSFDIDGGNFARAQALFDMDHQGTFNAIGAFGASSKGSDWTRYTLTFQNSNGFVVPVFELRDLNLVNNDSSVGIDNVAVLDAPNVTTQPQNLSVRSGLDATFQVSVTSANPVTFQWRRNGVEIPGATASTLVLASVLPEDAAKYSVRIRDAFSTVDSNEATLTVLRIESVQKGATDVVIAFTSSSGVNYSLEMNAALASNVWTPLQTGIAGTGGVVQVTHSGAGTRTAMFYRLRQGDIVSAPAGFQLVVVPRKRGLTVGRFPLALSFEERALDAGAATGSAASALIDAAAGWSPNEWSATPHVVRFTTGSAAGRLFRITGNTATQLNLDAEGDDLSGVLVAGDHYEIVPLATLASFFGVDGGALKKSTSVSRTDWVQLWNGTRFLTYFHDGTNWRLSGSTDNQNDTVLLPDQGIQIIRRGTTNLPILLTGQAATTVRRTTFHGPGVSFLANRFPADVTLIASGIGQLPGWISADRLQVWNVSQRRFNLYFFSRNHWRTLGVARVQDSKRIPSGTAFLVRRKSTASGATASLAQDPPFATEVTP